MLYDSLYVINLENANLWGWKAKWLLEDEIVVQEKWITKEQEEIFWGDGQIHYVDCDDAFTNVYRCQN